jgi:hypothetical protein
MLDAKDPVSEKKLAKGDAMWGTKMEMLGYWLDGKNRTVQLPANQAANLLKEVRQVLKKKRVLLKQFRSLTGRLQHAARILRSARAFFTPLKFALQGLPTFIGLSRHGEIRPTLLNIAVIICDLVSRPTHVSKLVQGTLNFVGYCDASAFGAGKVWFGGQQHLHPMV